MGRVQLVIAVGVTPECAKMIALASNVVNHRIWQLIAGPAWTVTADGVMPDLAGTTARGSNAENLRSLSLNADCVLAAVGCVIVVNAKTTVQAWNAGFRLILVITAVSVRKEIHGVVTKVSAKMIVLDASAGPRQTLA